MANTKISWTDFTWNPVWGCLGGCNYCYARGIAKRFAGEMIKKETVYAIDIRYEYERLSSFKPILLVNRLNTAFPKNAKLIFVNSMSDIAFWSDVWLFLVMERIRSNPDKIFQILTKFPGKLKQKIVEFPENVWFGLTVTTHNDLNARIRPFLEIKAGKHFISIEPIINFVDLSNPIPRVAKNRYNNPIIEFIDWVIIGCMTGNRRVKVSNDMVLKMINYAKGKNKPVFVKQLEFEGKIIKDNIPDPLNYREFPL